MAKSFDGSTSLYSNIHRSETFKINGDAVSIMQNKEELFVLEDLNKTAKAKQGIAHVTVTKRDPYAISMSGGMQNVHESRSFTVGFGMY